MNLGKLFRTTEEQVVPVQATVSGKIPSWLHGSLVRVGPGVFDLDSGFTVNHFFDGYSVLHKFTITNNKVEFSKKYLKSDAYLKAQKNGKPAYPEFATRAYADNANGFLARAFRNLIPNMTDNCNVEIIKIGNSYFAIKGKGNLRVIHPDDLSTGDKVELYPLLGIHLLLRRFLRDNNGDIYLITSAEPNGPNGYEIMRITDNSHSYAQAFQGAKIISRISTAFNCVFFTFGLTKKYLVFIDQPFIYDRIELSEGALKGKMMADCFKWNPRFMNRFYLIEKDTGYVLPTSIESEDTFFFFHIINCYEQNGEVIIDVIAYESPDVLDHLYLSDLRKGIFEPAHRPQGRRYILPLIDDASVMNDGGNLRGGSYTSQAYSIGGRVLVSHQVFCASSHEYPTINKKYMGQKYTYYYASGCYYSDQYDFSVIKVNVENGDIKSWFAGEGQIPSEPIFVESPDSSSEDDGVLLVSISTSEPGDTDKLVILDASTMEMISSASVPCQVPISRRGIFVEQ